jgi:hypothetical protein
MKVLRLIVASILVFNSISFAQYKKNIQHQNLNWYAFIQTTDIDKKWSLITEIHERHFISPLAQNQFLVRARLHRDIGYDWNASAGFSVFLNSSNNPKADFFISPELRPHLGMLYKQKLGLFNLNHRYITEARFFQNNTNDFYLNSFRFRYQIQAEISILKSLNDHKEWLYLKISDEIMINAGSRIVTNVFDQNRIYFAANLKINSALALEVGYLNSFQQQTSGNDFYDRDILRVIIFHKLSF